VTAPDAGAGAAAAPAAGAPPQGTPRIGSASHLSAGLQQQLEKYKPSYSSVHGIVQVLSVDDEEVNQIVLEEILSSAGYLFVRAMDAFEAQEILDQQDSLPDLMLVDSMMPGMSGQELCSLLRRSLPSTVLPIIMVSAKIDELNIVSGLNSGSNDFLRKPYNRLELLARINAQLRVRNECWWVAELAGNTATGSEPAAAAAAAPAAPAGAGDTPAYMSTALRLLTSVLPEGVLARMQKARTSWRTCTSMW